MKTMLKALIRQSYAKHNIVLTDEEITAIGKTIMDAHGEDVTLGDFLNAVEETVNRLI